MDTGKFVGLLLAFLVGALVLTAFVPIIDSTQHTIEKTINQNEGYNHTMDLIEDDVIIEIDYTNGGSEIEVTVGTETMDVDVSTASNVRTFLFYSDVCMLWVDRVANANVPVYALKSTGYTGNLSTTTSVFEYDSTTKEVTLTINGTETFNDIVEKFAYVYTADNGKYGFFNYGTNITLGENDSLEMFTSGGWWDITIVAYESTAKEWYKSTTTPIEGMVITSDSVPDEYPATMSNVWIKNDNGTYTRNSATVTVSYNDGDNEVTSNKSAHVIASIEYVSYEDNPTSDVVGLLPLIAGVGMLIWAVAYFLRRY